MKLITFLFLFSLIVYINSEECILKAASSVKDCQGLEKESPDNYCCYLEAKGKGFGIEGEVKACWELRPSEYNDIKNYIKNYEESAKQAGGSLDIKKLDCKSSYLALTLFSLLLFIL